MLTLKVEKLSLLMYFRPIILCNIIHKLITKTMMARLKPLPGGLVSLFQESFVPGCQITDKIIICQEIVYTLQGKKGKLYTLQGKKGKQGGMIIMIDLEKAYDGME